MTPERPNHTRATFGHRAPSYDGESSWVRDQELIDPLLEGLASGAAVADVCSGTGAIAERASALGFAPVALDLSPAMLSMNRCAGRIVATGSHLPLMTSSMDRVVCRQGLHYLDIATALAEFRRVSRGSVALGSITMLDSSDLQFWTSYFNAASPGRTRVFAPGELSSLLENSGFVVTGVREVIDQGTLLGPIKHLSATTQHAIRESFLISPIRERYGVVEIGADLQYVQRWEFVTAEIESRT